jgi:hypothetical protein
MQNVNTTAVPSDMAHLQAVETTKTLTKRDQFDSAVVLTDDDGEINSFNRSAEKKPNNVEFDTLSTKSTTWSTLDESLKDMDFIGHLLPFIHMENPTAASANPNVSKPINISNNNRESVHYTEEDDSSSIYDAYAEADTTSEDDQTHQAPFVSSETDDWDRQAAYNTLLNSPSSSSDQHQQQQSNTSNNLYMGLGARRKTPIYTPYANSLATSRQVSVSGESVVTSASASSIYSADADVDPTSSQESVRPLPDLSKRTGKLPATPKVAASQRSSQNQQGDHNAGAFPLSMAMETGGCGLWRSRSLKHHHNLGTGSGQQPGGILRDGQQAEARTGTRKWVRWGVSILEKKVPSWLNYLSNCILYSKAGAYGSIRNPEAVFTRGTNN